MGLIALARPARAQAPAHPWRDFQLIDGDGRSFRIGELRKKLTLVKLWANWCPACVDELSQVEPIVEGVGADNIDVVLVSHPAWWAADRDMARAHRVRATVATAHPRYSLADLQGTLTDEEGTFAVPRSLLFTASAGAPVWSHRGGVAWTSPEVLDRLRSWIG